jgi:hypothetical protein
MARANPDRTLEAILNAPDRADALARLTAALARTWESGHSTGWDDGVQDAHSSDRPQRSPNPYDGGGR